jgi:hypothetical protein
MSMRIAMMALVLSISASALANAPKPPAAPGASKNPPGPTSSEPSYCSVDKFVKMERANNITGLDRAHVYQVGSLTLAGLAIGFSDPVQVAKLAQQYSTYKPEEKSCTWYYNKGNGKAEAAFNWRYVSNPMMQDTKVATEYDNVLKNIFHVDGPNMVQCAVDHKFISMGCDGMRHRGPSVFAMLLAYSGCTAKSATAIANQIWGTNMVSVATREAIAQKGYEIGNRDPQGRATLQKLMLTPLTK